LLNEGRTRLGDPAWTEAYEGGRRLDPDRANQIAEDLLIDLRRQLEVGLRGSLTARSKFCDWWPPD
jgi:hypothetical protein